MHLLCTRDGADNGVIYVQGEPDAAGAVGSNDDTVTVYVGNANNRNRTCDSWIHSLRIFDTHIDPDEAPRLFEASRVQLWPGASKRSGIMSVAE
jgi:hypothetical protein